MSENYLIKLRPSFTGGLTIANGTGAPPPKIMAFVCGLSQNSKMWWGTQETDGSTSLAIFDMHDTPKPPSKFFIS